MSALPGSEVAADIRDGTIEALPPARAPRRPTQHPDGDVVHGERPPFMGNASAEASPAEAASTQVSPAERRTARRSVPSRRLGSASRQAMRTAAIPALLFVLALFAWGWWVAWRDVPDYLLPTPSGVWGALRDDPARYLDAGAVTLGHALGGLAAGSGAAFLLAVGMAHSRTAERALYPFAILVKVTPIVAIAPLIVIWFGFGYWPKVVVAALITFFPMLVNAVTGLRSVDPAAHDFLRSMNASRWQVLRMLRLPGSVPYVFAALRISVPLSLIGAVVAEWTAADSGMGQVIVIAHGDFDTAGLFAAIVVLAAIGVALTTALALVERRLLFWHDSHAER